MAVVTCLVALVGCAWLIAAYRQIDRTQQATREQVLQASATFTQVATTLRTATTATNDAASSLGTAQMALEGAAETTRTTATTLDQTADVINFTIPGLNIRPLAGVDTNFRTEAAQLRQLGERLDQAAGVLPANARDLRAIGTDLDATARQLDTNAGQLRRFAGEGDSGTLPMLLANFRLVILWSILVHLLLFLVGIGLYLLTIEVRQIAGAEPPVATEPAHVVAGKSSQGRTWEDE